MDEEYRSLVEEGISVPTSTILQIDDATISNQTELKNLLVNNFNNEQNVMQALVQDYNNYGDFAAQFENQAQDNGWKLNQALSSNVIKVYQKSTAININNKTANLTSNIIIEPEKVIWQTNELYHNKLALVSREINFTNDEQKTLNYQLLFTNETGQESIIYHHDNVALKNGEFQTLDTVFPPKSKNTQLAASLLDHNFSELSDLTTKTKMSPTQIVTWLLGFSSHLAATGCLEYGKIWAHSKLAFAARATGAFGALIMPILNYDMEKNKKTNSINNSYTKEILNLIFLSATILETIAFNIGRLSQEEQNKAHKNFFLILDNPENIKTLFFNSISGIFTGEQILGVSQFLFNMTNTIYKQNYKTDLVSEGNQKTVNTLLSTIRESLIVAGFSTLAYNIATGVVVTTTPIAFGVGLAGCLLAGTSALTGLTLKTKDLCSYLWKTVASACTDNPEITTILNIKNEKNKQQLDDLLKKDYDKLVETTKTEVKQFEINFKELLEQNLAGNEQLNQTEKQQIFRDFNSTTVALENYLQSPVSIDIKQKNLVTTIHNFLIKHEAALNLTEQEKLTILAKLEANSILKFAGEPTVALNDYLQSTTPTAQTTADSTVIDLKTNKATQTTDDLLSFFGSKNVLTSMPTSTTLDATLTNLSKTLTPNVSQQFQETLPNLTTAINIGADDLGQVY